MGAAPAKRLDPRVKEVLARALGTDRITLESSAATMEAWDSVAHLELVIGLEERFAIRFSFAEMVELTKVRRIVDKLAEKGVLG